MTARCSTNCIIPPHILLKLLEAKDKAIRETALNTLLASAQVRSERALMSGLTVANDAGGKRRTIYDAKQNQISSGDLIRGEGDPASSDAAVNDAYDGLGVTYDFYETVFQRKSLDNHGMRLDAVVHYGNEINNAFWNGSRMLFGDGDGVQFRNLAKSLDVIAHELAHGVTQFTADLKYHNQSGALNESVSDVFGSMVKQWHRGETAANADWLIGENIFTPAISGDALRSLKSPGKAYDNELLGRDPQPAHMDDFVDLPDTPMGDNGGVHINSGIPNHAFYRLATAIGGEAWKLAGPIWYDALTKRISQNTEFQEFAEATFEAAGTLFGATEQEVVRTAWDDVGIEIDLEGIASVGGRPPYADMRRRAADSDPCAELKAQLDTLTKRVDKLAKKLR